eukprot:m.19192 g.19192  ORF g.19192 m.19192 type:complete len:372 (+) comp3725_c0_seq1:1358-2473(+)
MVSRWWFLSTGRTRGRGVRKREQTESAREERHGLSTTCSVPSHLAPTAVTASGTACRGPTCCWWPVRVCRRSCCWIVWWPTQELQHVRTSLTHFSLFPSFSLVLYLLLVLFSFKLVCPAPYLLCLLLPRSLRLHARRLSQTPVAAHVALACTCALQRYPLPRPPACAACPLVAAAPRRQGLFSCYHHWWLAAGNVAGGSAGARVGGRSAAQEWPAAPRVVYTAAAKASMPPTESQLPPTPLLRLPCWAGEGFRVGPVLGLGSALLSVVVFTAPTLSTGEIVHNHWSHESVLKMASLFAPCASRVVPVSLLSRGKAHAAHAHVDIWISDRSLVRFFRALSRSRSPLFRSTRARAVCFSPRCGFGEACYVLES